MNRPIVLLVDFDKVEHNGEGLISRVCCCFEDTGFFYAENHTEKRHDDQLNSIKPFSIWMPQHKVWYVKGDLDFIKKSLSDYLDKFNDDTPIKVVAQDSELTSLEFNEEFGLRSVFITTLKQMAKQKEVDFKWAMESDIRHDIEMVQKVKRMRANYFKILLS